ncbi:unnamed protein product [Pedinophyceae sp. YPF-701]|nr:unnamed protein product [Pedinophyceae sp. YPF-701]
MVAVGKVEHSANLTIKDETTKAKDAMKSFFLAGQVSKVVKDFQVQRTRFVEEVHSLLEQNLWHTALKELHRNQITKLLCNPLICDAIPGVQAGALRTLAKCVRGTNGMGEALIERGSLADVVDSAQHGQGTVTQAAHGALQAIAHESVSAAQAVIEAGVVEIIRGQLDMQDHSLKEAGVKTLNVLVAANADLASDVMGGDMLEVLVGLLAVKEVQGGYKVAIASTLADTCSHGEPFAQAIVNAGCVPTIWHVTTLSEAEPKVLAELFKCLGHICYYNEELASVVKKQARALQLPSAFLKDPAAPLRRAASALVLQMLKYGGDFCYNIVESGDLAGLVRFIQLERATPNEGMTGVLSLGYIAREEASLGKAVCDCGALEEVTVYLQGNDMEVLSAACWALHCVAQHGKETALPLAMRGMLTVLLGVYSKAHEGSEAQLNAKEALKAIIRNCATPSALEPLVTPETPSRIIKHVLRVLLRLMQHSPEARQSFLTSGALQRLQQMEGDLGLASLEVMSDIHKLYPTDVVQYYRAAPGRTTGTGRRSPRVRSPVKAEPS